MDIFEILVPLIFAAIYFFGNMFSGKSKEEEDAPPTLPRSRGAQDEPDAAERQRRIQEEIRRKIMERRRASGSGSDLSPPPPRHALRERREQVEARREARQEREARHASAEASRERPSAYPAPSHEMHSEPKSGTFTWDESDNAYDSTMQARLRRIEETKRKAEKLQKQAAERSESSGERSKQRKRRSGAYFTGTVRESLQDPQAARAAFIYGEVLGQPISLRKGASNVPGMNEP